MGNNINFITGSSTAPRCSRYRSSTRSASSLNMAHPLRIYLRKYPEGRSASTVTTRSITSPPCEEVALCHAYMTTLKISEHQLEKLRAVKSCETEKMVVDNFKNIQSDNLREVLQHRERSLSAYNLTSHG